MVITADLGMFRSSLGDGVIVTQSGRHAVRTLPRVVVELVVQVLWIVRIFVSCRIWVSERRVTRQRFDSESVRRVEVQVFFKSVSVEEIIAHPPCGKRGEMLL